MTIYRSAVCAAALLATATMTVSPVLAATRTVPISIPLSAKPTPQPGWTSAQDSWSKHRWRGYRHHRNRIDGGDLLAGILVIGGIAAIASAAGDSKNRRDERREYPRNDRPYDYRDDYRSDGRDRDYDGGDPGNGRGAMDRAVDACAAEAARSGQVDEIFDVERIDGEWRVKGDYRNGRTFTCSVDGNGKAYVGADDQARNDERDSRGGQGEADDRYATAQSPDFADPRGR